jgi:DNA-binding MarR family transcriptional regulator
MRLSALVNNVVLSLSGLTQLLGRMEAAGLVERKLSKTDRRRFDMLFTDAGRKEVEWVMPGHQQAVRDRCLQYPASEKKTAIHSRLAKVIVANDTPLPCTYIRDI